MFLIEKLEQTLGISVIRALTVDSKNTSNLLTGPVGIDSSSNKNHPAGAVSF